MDEVAVIADPAAACVISPSVLGVLALDPERSHDESSASGRDRRTLLAIHPKVPQDKKGTDS